MGQNGINLWGSLKRSSKDGGGYLAVQNALKKVGVGGVLKGMEILEV